ncbi:glycosyltransferase, partial [Rhizobium ruizarguesonis]
TDECRALTPTYVNTATGLQLHHFTWLENEDLLGELPVTWNYLVNEYDYREDAKNAPFTDGGPYFEEYKNYDYAEGWFAARERRRVAQQPV